MSKKLICSECGYEITEGEEYYEVLDNFLQAHYFGSDGDGIFCSPACLMRNITCESKILGGEE